MIAFFHQDLRRPHGLGFEPVPGLKLGGSPEDFVVDEVPAFAFTGEGEHLYVHLEKRKSASAFVADRLAKIIGVDRKDVSYAGQKDTQAVTRQWFSVYDPGRVTPPDLASRLQAEGITLLAQDRHTHKLRAGQLFGNRFSMSLISEGELPHGTEKALTQALRTLEETGAPNYFGPQRFGRTGNNALLGRHLLDQRRQAFLEAYNAEAERPARRIHDVSPSLRRLFVSAFQSELFNRYLMLRGPRYNERIGGDLLTKGNRSFHDDGAADISERLATGEIELSGPIFGSKMRAARDEAGKLEQAILAEAGVSLGQFRGNPLFPRAQGARRPLSFRPHDATIETEADRIRLRVTLPRGCYATVLVGLLTDHYGAIPSTLTESA